jgi:hypothetical protein
LFVPPKRFLYPPGIAQPSPWIENIAHEVPPRAGLDSCPTRAPLHHEHLRKCTPHECLDARGGDAPFNALLLEPKCDTATIRHRAGEVAAHHALQHDRGPPSQHCLQKNIAPPLRLDAHRGTAAGKLHPQCARATAGLVAPPRAGGREGARSKRCKVQGEAGAEHARAPWGLDASGRLTPPLESRADASGLPDVVPSPPRPLDEDGREATLVDHRQSPAVVLVQPPTALQDVVAEGRDGLDGGKWLKRLLWGGKQVVGFVFAAEPIELIVRAVAA